MIVVGAAIIMAIMQRFPIVMLVGGALLGWVAGEMLVSDPWLEGQLGTALVHRLEMPMAALGALFVVGLGYLLKRRAHQAPASGSELGH